MNTHQIEKELWEAADQLRANSKLTAAEYSMPVLGLIFLRHADNRFKAYMGEIEQAIPAQVPAAQRETLIKLEFQGKAAMYLPEEARFDYLADLPQGKDVGQAIDDAMELIENEYEVLKGALPRGYTAFERDLLAELLKIFSRDSLKKATGDVFGLISVVKSDPTTAKRPMRRPDRSSTTYGFESGRKTGRPAASWTFAPRIG